jgi:hypothetical protein
MIFTISGRQAPQPVPAEVNRPIVSIVQAEWLRATAPMRRMPTFMQAQMMAP